MSKQKLIEKIAEAIKDELSRNYYREVDNYGHTEYERYTEEDAQSVANDIILELQEEIEQLDEPQKPVVPTCAKPWLEQAQYSTDVIDLFSEVEYATDADGFISKHWRWSPEFYDWLCDDADTLYLLCDALRYGYEVEKEPLYQVKLKFGRQYLSKNADGNKFDFYSCMAFPPRFSKKELESIENGAFYKIDGDKEWINPIIELEPVEEVAE